MFDDRSDESCSTLPPDLWIQVFSRLTITDLGRCALVCRLWCEFLHRDPTFMALAEVYLTREGMEEWKSMDPTETPTDRTEWIRAVRYRLSVRRCLVTSVGIRYHGKHFLWMTGWEVQSLTFSPLVLQVIVYRIEGWEDFEQAFVTTAQKNPPYYRWTLRLDDPPRDWSRTINEIMDFHGPYPIRLDDDDGEIAQAYNDCIPPYAQTEKDDILCPYCASQHPEVAIILDQRMIPREWVLPPPMERERFCISHHFCVETIPIFSDGTDERCHHQDFSLCYLNNILRAGEL